MRRLTFFLFSFLFIFSFNAYALNNSDPCVTSGSNVVCGSGEHDGDLSVAGNISLAGTTFDGNASAGTISMAGADMNGNAIASGDITLTNGSHLQGTKLFLSSGGSVTINGGSTVKEVKMTSGHDPQVTVQTGGRITTLKFINAPLACLTVEGPSSKVFNLDGTKVCAHVADGGELRHYAQGVVLNWDTDPVCSPCGSPS